MGEAFVGPVSGGEPELEIMRDLLKRGAMVTPVALVVTGLVWGIDGAISTGFAIAIVLVNFVMAAWMNSRAARISAALLGGVAMFGFIIRLSVVFVAFWLTKDASWMKVVPFGLTIVVTHLGLLFWEMKFVSATLAFPGLKPTPASIPSAATKEP